MKSGRAALLILLTLGVLWPRLAAEGQQAGKLWRIGLFHVGLDHDPPSLAPLRESLKRLGYEEGKNVHLDYRNQADEEAARATAVDFVRTRVDLIIAFENQAVRAAQAASSQIPVVFVHVSDPVAAGFVKSMARPGGNSTGVADYVGELHDKRIQILSEIVQLRRLLVLTDPTDPAVPMLTTVLTSAAAQLNVQLVERRATTETDVARIFAALKRNDVDGVIVSSPKLLTNFPELILRLSLERQIPLAHHRKALVEKGALFSYGPNFTVVGQDVAGYVDRIIRGAKPADLPVQAVAQLELVINLKTAKALGLTIPPSLLLRADQLIE
ncbi:MAG TPA: ABC transporter substrate-binding protein [Methylomirabilota bacterium]|nr:ABC transporter substrate-binding protein [Methylomirabilota bacterium]